MGNVFKAQISCSCDALVNRCMDFIGGKWVYVCHLEDNLKSLEKSVGEIGSMKDDMMTNITMAERQGKTCLKQVELWLSRVDDKIKETNTLLEIREPETKKLCLGCCSSNFSSSYKYGKRVDRLLKEVDDLIKQAKEFKEVAIVTLPEQMIVLPLEATVGLESNLQSIINHLMDKDVSIVGIFGEVGVGKTTILKEVNNIICQNETSSFDVVILVEVSENSMNESIQNHIGKKIGFSGAEWISKTFNDKAIDISNVLKKKRFVLLLDDVFESLNLREIGVPVGRTSMISKVVFTTHLERVCLLMRAEKILKVQPLGFQDSWRLFSERIGEDNLNANSDIYNLAKELVEECGGIPKILIKWAHNMACKSTVHEWTEALKLLRTPVIDSQEIIESSKATEEAEDNGIEGIEDGESATTSTSGATLEDIHAFERHIRGETLRKKLEFACESIRVHVDDEYRKAIDYASSLRVKYENATIVIFSNATGGTLKFSGAKDWCGHFAEKPTEVQYGQWGILLHMPGMPRGFCSSGAIVYTAEHARGFKCDWMMAWKNMGPPGEGFVAKPFIKFTTQVQRENHFSNAVNWSPVNVHMMRAVPDSHFRGSYFDSKMYLVHGLLFAVLSCPEMNF